MDQLIMVLYYGSIHTKVRVCIILVMARVHNTILVMVVKFVSHSR